MAVNNPIAQDIIVDNNNDLFIDPRTGDLRISASDNQHISDILQSDQGWWKQFLFIGAALRKLLKNKFNVQVVENTVKQQLEVDGYQVGRPQVSIDSGGNATIKPNAIRVKF